MQKKLLFKLNNQQIFFIILIIVIIICLMCLNISKKKDDSYTSQWLTGNYSGYNLSVGEFTTRDLQEYMSISPIQDSNMCFAFGKCGSSSVKFSSTGIYDDKETEFTDLSDVLSYRIEKTSFDLEDEFVINGLKFGASLNDIKEAYAADDMLPIVVDEYDDNSWIIRFNISDLVDYEGVNFVTLQFEGSLNNGLSAVDVRSYK